MNNLKFILILLTPVAILSFCHPIGLVPLIALMGLMAVA
jgi:hypothetical protein